jgi:16S rRNA (uracil1498-N3)-methyltransferase
MHTIYFPDLPESPSIVIDGAEAHHAVRVKRLETGDLVRLCNGRGQVADARVKHLSKPRGEWRMDLEITARRTEPKLAPALHVFAAAPKGDRLEHMIDGLSQAGAASWAPLSSTRAIVEPRESKLARLERTCTESIKQCGRAWAMELGDGADVRAALASPGAIVIADASGAPYEPCGESSITLLIGPEGGWTPEELGAANARGARLARFGPNVLRTETAAVVAVACILDHESRAPRRP